MTDVYATKMTQVSAQFAAVLSQIKTLNNEAKAAAAAAQAGADDSDKLEGLSLAQVVELIAGSTGITVQAVKDDLDLFIARTDNPHGVTAAQIGLSEVENFGVATNAEALLNTTADKVITPVQMWHVLDDFWADKVGSSPAALDTIRELATALQDNPDVITTIQDGLALKADQTALDALNTSLTAAINAAEPVWATDAQALAGVATNVAMSPKAVAAVRAEQEADTLAAFTSIETALADGLAALQA